MNLTVSTCPPGATMLTADCTICGGTFRALTEVRARVDHRCPTPVIGPVWVLTETEPVRRRGLLPSYEASA